MGRLFILLCAFAVSGCSLFRGAREVNKVVNKVGDFIPKAPITKIRDLMPEYAKPDLSIDFNEPISLPSPMPPRAAILKDSMLQKEIQAGLIYDMVRDETLKRVDKQIEEKLHSNTTITQSQSWLFYVIGALGIIAGIVVLIVIKTPKTALTVGLAGLSMLFIPTFIEAIHGLLKGLVFFFYGSLILGFACLLAWVGYKVYHFIPKSKEIDKPKD